jgi:hypothetical protein
MMSELEAGTYWIKDRHGNWVIADYSYGVWWMVESSEIEERGIQAIGPRILPPEELEGK